MNIEQVPSLTFINESGLYSIILRSRKKEAKRFKKWVTSEVLPSIRKTGKYDVMDAMPDKILKHKQREIQIDMSKETARHYLPNYGKNALTRYYSLTSTGFTGRTPAQLQAEAKALKVPYSQRNSGRECIRTFWPETAASISLQDELVVKENVNPAEAHTVAKAFEPGFAELKRIGKLGNEQLPLFDCQPVIEKEKNLPNPFPLKVVK